MIINNINNYLKKKEISKNFSLMIRENNFDNSFLDQNLCNKKFKHLGEFIFEFIYIPKNGINFLYECDEYKIKASDAKNKKKIYLTIKKENVYIDDTNIFFYYFGDIFQEKNIVLEKEVEFCSLEIHKNIKNKIYLDDPFDLTTIRFISCYYLEINIPCKIKYKIIFPDIDVLILQINETLLFKNKNQIICEYLIFNFNDHLFRIIKDKDNTSNICFQNIILKGINNDLIENEPALSEIIFLRDNQEIRKFFNQIVFEDKKLVKNANF